MDTLQSICDSYATNFIENHSISDLGLAKPTIRTKIKGNSRKAENLLAMSNSAENRRQDTRHPHRAHAALSSEAINTQVHLLNLSRRGALIAVLEPHTLKVKDEVALTITSDLGEVTMRGTLAHMKAHYLGIHCSAASGTDEQVLDAILKQINDQAEA